METMGTFWGPKIWKRSHGDPGTLMGTHLGAVPIWDFSFDSIPSNPLLTFVRSKNIHYFIDFYWPSQALKSVSKNIQIRRFLFWEVWNSGFEGWPPRWWMRACIGWMSEGRAGSIGLNLPHLRNRSSDTGTGRPDWWSNTPPCVFITCFNIYIKFLLCHREILIWLRPLLATEKQIICIPRRIWGQNSGVEVARIETQHLHSAQHIIGWPK